MTSATFEIARTATIQSDDVGHKVSIAQLDFKPEFEYISTPKLVSHAFLKVKAKNESAYALLAGDANVFLDNNFLAKVSCTSPWITKIFHMPKGITQPALICSNSTVETIEQCVKYV